MRLTPSSIASVIGISALLACTDREIPEDSADEVEAICDRLCRKITLCDDGYPVKTEDECFEHCTAETVLYEKDACGEAHRSLGACLGSLSCEDRALRRMTNVLDLEVEHPCREEEFDIPRSCQSD